MDEFKGTQALDAGLISAAQAVEHYEIARYGTLKTWADQLGLREATRLLDQTLGEEEATDKKLTQLAMSDANRKGRFFRGSLIDEGQAHLVAHAPDQPAGLQAVRRDQHVEIA
jgi:hypothetical protein